VQLAAAARLVLPVDGDLAGREHALRLAARVDEAGELEQLTEPDHPVARLDLSHAPMMTQAPRHYDRLPMPHKNPLLGLAAVLICALLLPGAAQAAKPKQQYYVSVGDSYAVGWQRMSADEATVTKQGFADQVVPLARRKGYRLKLVKFGCAGATTSSTLNTKGCPAAGRAIDGPR